MEQNQQRNSSTTEQSKKEEAFQPIVVGRSLGNSLRIIKEVLVTAELKRTVSHKVSTK
jgi:hypothetical protein